MPHHGEWAVKITGGYGKKPVKVTNSLEEAKRAAVGVAIKYEVPLLEYDADGNLVAKTPWKKL